MVKDKFYMTYILFYSLGTATLIPANFFTTATDVSYRWKQTVEVKVVPFQYWMYKFRDLNGVDLNISDTNSLNRTRMQAEFVSDYSIVSNVSNLFFLVITIAFLRKLSMIKRTIGALCGAIVMFAITCLFVQVDTDTCKYYLRFLIFFSKFFFRATYFLHHNTHNRISSNWILCRFYGHPLRNDCSISSSIFGGNSFWSFDLWYFCRFDTNLRS